MFALTAKLLRLQFNPWISFIICLIFIPLSIDAQPLMDEMLGRYKIIYDSTYINSEPADGYTYSRYFFAQVSLAEKGRNVLSTPATPVIDPSDKIEIIAFTKLPSGEIAFVDSSNIVLLQLPGEQRRYFINYPQPLPGSDLYLEWTLHSNRAPLSGQRVLARTVPVDSATVVLTVPQWWIFNFKLYPDSTEMPGLFDEFNTKIGSSFVLKPEKNLRNYSWTAVRLPGLTREEFSPSIEKLIPTLYYSFSHDSRWQDQKSSTIIWPYIARVYSDQLLDFIREPEPLDIIADSLSALSTSSPNLLQAALDWFFDGFKITSDDIAINQDFKSLMTSRLGTQGECAALCYLLLQKLEFRVTPYLGSSRKIGEPLYEIPALYWFDKFLIALESDSDTLWLDLTSSNLPVDIIPFENQGIPALNVGENPGKFHRTPQLNYRDNGKAIHLNVIIDSLGNFFCNVTEVYSYAMISEVLKKISGRDPSAIRSDWEKRLSLSIPGVKLENMAIIPRDSTSDVFRVAYQFKAPSPFRFQADRIYISSDFLGNWAAMPSFDSDKRRAPIDIDKPRFELERITVKFASNLKLDYLPESNSFDSFLGECFSAYRAQGNTISITRAFGLKRQRVPPGGFDSLKKLFNKIHSETDKQVILKRIN